MERNQKLLNAFYGGPVQEGRIGQLEGAIINCVSAIVRDLKKEFDDKISKGELELGTYAALEHMADNGAYHPSIYTAEGDMGIHAFQAACSVIRNERFQNQQRSHLADMGEGLPLPNFPKHQAIWDVYHELKGKVGAIEAYKELIKMDSEFLDLGGYGNFLLYITLPQREGIYYNEEVIQAVNDHPILHDRTEPCDRRGNLRVIPPVVT